MKNAKRARKGTTTATEISDQTPSGIAEAASGGTPSMGNQGGGENKQTGTKRRQAASKGRTTGTANRSRSKNSGGTPSLGRTHTQGFTPITAAALANIASEMWDPRQPALNNRRMIGARVNDFLNAYQGPAQV